MFVYDFFLTKKKKKKKEREVAQTQFTYKWAQFIKSLFKLAVLELSPKNKT